jgi:hypothetical protein
MNGWRFPWAIEWRYEHDDVLNGDDLSPRWNGSSSRVCNRPSISECILTLSRSVLIKQRSWSVANFHWPRPPEFDERDCQRILQRRLASGWKRRERILFFFDLYAFWPSTPRQIHSSMGLWRCIILSLPATGIGVTIFTALKCQLCFDFAHRSLLYPLLLHLWQKRNVVDRDRR